MIKDRAQVMESCGHLNPGSKTGERAVDRCALALALTASGATIRSLKYTPQTASRAVSNEYGFSRQLSKRAMIGIWDKNIFAFEKHFGVWDLGQKQFCIWW